jgi:hypothetical protein
MEANEDKSTVSFADFVGQKDTYALRVRGNSMIEDHTCEGDRVRAKPAMRYRGRAGWRLRDDAQALLQGIRKRDPAGTRERFYERDPRSLAGGSDPGAAAGGAAKVVFNEKAAGNLNSVVFH